MIDYTKLDRDTAYLAEEIAFICELPVEEVKEELINNLDTIVERVVLDGYIYWNLK